jgi:predicted MFS family arabinose efflux permease
MRIEYNKKHVQASVITAALLGMALGTWIGARSTTASVWEWLGVLIAFSVLAGIVMSKIDQSYLIKSDEK